jgi:hypothetical protein
MYGKWNNDTTYAAISKADMLSGILEYFL